jgi:regulatory protein YycI of two-component signal transduction system YycFG
VLACNTGTCLKEKVQLRNNLESANAKIKDLEAKIELLVCEKKNLTTAIRIIQEDNSQQNNNNCLKNKKARGLKLEINNLRKRKRSVNMVRPRNRHNTLLQNRKKICHKYQKKHKLFSLTTYQMTKRETKKRKTTLSERKPTRALRLQCQLWATP